MRSSFLLFLLLGGILNCVSSQTYLSPELENKLIWGSTELDAETTSSFTFMNDGRHYAQLQDGRVEIYDIVDGACTDTIVSSTTLKIEGQEDSIYITDYIFSPDERLILLETLPEGIYRYSVKAEYIIYNIETGKAQYLDQRGKQMFPSFNQDGTQVAFLWKNDIYIKDLSNDEMVAVTQDGEWNHIINGGTDWVYEEEFDLTKAYEWSHDGQYIAYMKFDESEVPQFDLKYYNDQSYPEKYSYKYPKVDQRVSRVQVNIYNTLTRVTTSLEVPFPYEEYYIPRIKWMPESQKLIVYYLNRLQNHLQLIAYNAENGEHHLLLEERNERYLEVEVYDNLAFVPGQEQFLWTSEKDGWNQLYLHDFEGKELKKLTKGEYDVIEFYGYDAEHKKAYYQAAKQKPTQREVYGVDIVNEKTEVLEDSAGWNEASFSSTFDYYIYRYANINTPPMYSVNDRSGDTIRTLIQNRALKYYQKRYKTKPFDFFNIEIQNGNRLNAWMLKPYEFDESKSYPLLMFVYGGPNSQEVVDDWLGNYYWWFQMLAQNGYVVACIDNRGTGARGEEFRKVVYGELGKYETEDQISAARFLSKKPFIDSNHIGVFGWSYGGYLSSLCLLKGNDVFSSAVAIAPVTNWKWYDAIYTERYMGMYRDNKKGYNQNAPLFYVDQLKGNYLLVHGLADDNVHFQHTAEMANALIEADKQFDTYFYPNRAHGINDLKAQLHLFNKITSFLDENLKP